MATNANWTIIFDDKMIIKNYAEGASEGISYVIDDDSFWSDSKFSNIWAIQYGTSISTDEVEYKDETQHTTYATANLGDISQFSSRWDSAHLTRLQADWDNDNNGTGEGDNFVSETEAEKIARLGARPTSYSS
jgi:hypothetical protein|tara:strand:+ start:533 stop:931 length:399 start_codon:yes stop_codon:yes gene_type:complete